MNLNKVQPARQSFNADPVKIFSKFHELLAKDRIQFLFCNDFCLRLNMQYGVGRIGIHVQGLIKGFISNPQGSAITSYHI